MARRPLTKFQMMRWSAAVFAVARYPVARYPVGQSEMSHPEQVLPRVEARNG
jgi:hypothetical protein